jgi:hypothetical protein
MVEGDLEAAKLVYAGLGFSIGERRKESERHEEFRMPFGGGGSIELTSP